MVSEDGESKDNESVILSCSVEESPLTSVEVRGIVDRVTPAAGKRNQHSEEDSVGMECGWKQVGDWEGWMTCRVYYVNGSHSITVNTVDENGRLCEIGTLTGHSKAVNALCCNDELRLLASCDEDVLLLWDTDSQCIVHQFRNVLTSLPLHCSIVSSVFSGSGLFFARAPVRAKSTAGT